MKMEKIKVGIVGSQFSAGLHAQAYQRTGKVELVAASAIDNLNEFCQKYRIADSYRDFREMFKRDDIELVSVCVPNFLHKEVVIAAAESKKDIVCEKPLATCVEDAQEMLKVAKENRVKLMYAEDWLLAPAIRRAKSICEEGAIGQVLYLKAKETHPGSHSLYAQKIRYCGGGAIIHLAIHPIGFVRWFKGKEVVEVVGRISGGARNNLKHHNFEGEDWGVAILTFEDKSQALVEGNYVTCGGLDDVVEVYGSKGVIKINLSQGSPLSVYSSDGYSYAIEKAEITKGWTKPAVDEEASLGYIDEIAHFVDCVSEDKEPQLGVRGEDGLKALEITEAIYKSAREGRAIKMKK